MLLLSMKYCFLFLVAECFVELSWMWIHIQISWSIIVVGYVSHVSLAVMYIRKWEIGMCKFYVRIIYLVEDCIACLSKQVSFGKFFERDNQECNDLMH